MKLYADQLASTLQPQNCVPNSMLNCGVQRLSDFAKLFDYQRAQKERGPDIYALRETRTVAIDLTQSEVYVLMRNATKSLLYELENAPFRCDTGMAIKRLNELQAVMPSYKAPDISGE